MTFDSVPDATGYSSEPPPQPRSAEAEHYANDLAMLTEIFSSSLQRHTLAHELQRIAAFIARDGQPLLCTDHAFADLYEKYGAASLLRALAAASEGAPR